MTNVPSARTSRNACAKIFAMAAKTDKNPLTHFGRQVRKDRQARGWSLDEMAARTGLAAPYWSQIENGKRPPTERVAQACDRVFPERRGWFLEYYEESRTWTPAGFRSWAEHEDRSATLRVWSPGIVHGLLQTEAYARELLSVSPGMSDEVIAARLASRMERQRRVLYRDEPPAVWFVVDEVALYRYVGSPEIMAEQLSQLEDVASLPNVTMTVMPAVTHPGNESEFIITDDAVYAEHAVAGFVYTDEEIVIRLATRFDSLRGESYRVSDSLARVRRMRDVWTTGVRAATAAAREDRVLKSPPPTV
jgi:transcriptional regulator with XRE-family HTH domain